MISNLITVNRPDMKKMTQLEKFVDKHENNMTSQKWEVIITAKNETKAHKQFLQAISETVRNSSWVNPFQI